MLPRSVNSNLSSNLLDCAAKMKQLPGRRPPAVQDRKLLLRNQRRRLHRNPAPQQQHPRPRQQPHQPHLQMRLQRQRALSRRLEDAAAGGEVPGGDLSPWTTGAYKRFLSVRHVTKSIVKIATTMNKPVDIGLDIRFCHMSHSPLHIL